MANISTFLQAIMSARYGKDVRQSIHDGIKAINDEVAADKNEVIASKEAAENAATAASTSAQEASASESAAKKSETAAAASESAVSTSAQKASASESAAKKSETAAAASESSASTSAQEASASESAAKKSENAAAASESAAATSAQKASASESAAKKSETAAAASKSAASTSAQTAIDKATLAKSYAVGGTGTRAGEDTDNAKYYMTQAEKQTGGIPTKLSQLENDAGFIAEDGDGSGLTVGFTEAAARENIASGENTGTLMGKIKKWLADLAAAAFMQVITSYADLMAGTALDNYLIGAAAAKEGFTELNSKLSITNNVFGINTSIGISFVSANCSVCVNNVYYIDAFVQLTETVPENGTLFYVVKNDNVITFNRRLDAILINVLNGKIYQIMLLKDSNIFIANGTSIPSGFYKVTMIISI